MSETARLTKAQKAAAVLVAMGKPVASRLLKFFKQEELKALIEGARMLKTIPQAELERIVAEFEQEFAEGAGLLDSADEMDTILNETLSPEEMSALMSTRGEQGDKEAAPPPPLWPQLDALEPHVIGERIGDENPQVVACVLASLATQQAAAVLLVLPKAGRGEIVKRMMAMGPLKPAARAMLEDRLRRELLGEKGPKDNAAGQIRVASLLNELDKSQLEEVMSDLAAAGTTDLDAIRSRLFAFEDIVLLDQRSRVSLFDGIAADTVTLALRGADAALAESVLSSIGARTRRMIEAELAADVPVAADEIAKARKQIASTAVRLSAEGSVELPGAKDAA